MNFSEQDFNVNDGRESVYVGMNVMILPGQLKKKCLNTKCDDDSKD